MLAEAVAEAATAEAAAEAARAGVEAATAEANRSAVAARAGAAGLGVRPYTEGGAGAGQQGVGGSPGGPVRTPLRRTHTREPTKTGKLSTDNTITWITWECGAGCSLEHLECDIACIGNLIRGTTST